MHRKSAIENPGQTVGNEIFGAYLYLLNHPAHIESSCSQNFQSMRDVPPNQSIFSRRFRSAGRSIQSTVRYTELAPGRFKNIWRTERVSCRQGSVNIHAVHVPTRCGGGALRHRSRR